MKPTDEHLTDEDIFGVPGYDEDPQGREEKPMEGQIAEDDFGNKFVDGTLDYLDCEQKGRGDDQYVLSRWTALDPNGNPTVVSFRDDRSPNARIAGRLSP